MHHWKGKSDISKPIGCKRNRHHKLNETEHSACSTAKSVPEVVNLNEYSSQIFFQSMPCGIGYHVYSHTITSIVVTYHNRISTIGVFPLLVLASWWAGLELLPGMAAAAQLTGQMYLYWWDQLITVVLPCSGWGLDCSLEGKKSLNIAPARRKRK